MCDVIYEDEGVGLQVASKFMTLSYIYCHIFFPVWMSWHFKHMLLLTSLSTTVFDHDRLDLQGLSGMYVHMQFPRLSTQALDSRYSTVLVL